jgi:dTDP-4-amino-4,6-dideoxygalactose transaminase
MYDSGMLYPDQFTDRLVEQVKRREVVNYVLPVSSCSLGLILLLSTVQAGSKVVMPGFTFSATLQALEWNNLVPVIVDVDDNGQMPPALVEDCLQEHPDVACILPVHMWGNACYVKEYEELRKKTGIPVFFDGAHAFGTSVEDLPVGRFGAATVFSIAATKPVSAGEGGLIVTDDSDLYEFVRHSAFHGLYNSLDTMNKGMNAKIQEFNSILGYHAINMFERTKAIRRARMDEYRRKLQRLPLLPLRIWKPQEEVDPSYKDCVVFTESNELRDALEQFLNQHGVGTKKYFDPAIPDMGSFDGVVHSCDNARKLAATCLTLPLYPALTDSEMEYIITMVRRFFYERS